MTADANVTLQREEYEVLEGNDEVATLCAELTGGILERGVVVSMSTSDDTAIGEHIDNNSASVTQCHVMIVIFPATSDYNPLSNFMLYFEAGSPLNSVVCANVTIIDDIIIEPDQSFAVSLSTMDPVFLTPISSAVVIIATDNDSKSVLPV